MIRNGKVMSRKFILLILLNLFAVSNGYAIQVEEIESKEHHIKAMYKEDKSTPIVTINFFFEGGSLAYSSKKQSIAELEHSMLFKGAGKYNASKLNEALSKIGARLYFTGENNYFSGSLTTPVQGLSEAVNIFKTMLTQPLFKEKDLKKLKEDRHQFHTAEINSEETIMTDTFNKQLFGDHPYGKSQKEIVDSVDKVKREDLLKFLKRCLAKDNLKVAISGGVSHKQARKLLDDMFGFLPKKAKLKETPKVKLSFTGKTTNIPMDLPNSSIVFLQHGLQQNDSCHLKSYLLMRIMGGNSLSRLYKRLRNEKGLVYGVYCSDVESPESGYIQGGTKTSAENVETVVSLIKEEWTKLRDQGITAEELARAKTQITESFAFNFLTSQKSADFITYHQKLGRGADYFNNYGQNFKAITLEEMNEFARDFIAPEELTFIIAGKHKSLGMVQ